LRNLLLTAEAKSKNTRYLLTINHDF